MIPEITSLKDDKIQLAKSLNSIKGRMATGKFLIEGVEAIGWALDAEINIDFVLIAKQVKKIDHKLTNLDIYSVSDGLLKKVTDTSYVIPVVAVGNIKDNPQNTDFILVLDNLQDYGNIGTIIRTCHAFGVNTVLSTKQDVDLYQRKTMSASRGRVFGTHFKSLNTPTDTVAYLKEKGYQIVTTSPYGDNVQSMVSLPDKPVALIVGNETHGASKELMQAADITVQIPMQNQVESLNVGVATGISIYELYLKQVLGMIEKKIKSTLGREINVTAMMIREVLDRELSKISDLSSTRLIFMMVLKCDTIMSITDVQKQFGVPDKEKDAFFEPLLSKGLVNMDPAGNLTITEKGIETIGKLWTIIENAENKIMQAFTDQEKRELKRLIEKLKSRCIEIINTP